MMVPTIPGIVLCIFGLETILAVSEDRFAPNPDPFVTSQTSNWHQCYTLCGAMLPCRAISYSPSKRACRLISRPSLPHTDGTWLNRLYIPDSTQTSIDCGEGEVRAKTAADTYMCLNYVDQCANHPRIEGLMVVSTFPSINGARSVYACAEGYNPVDGSGACSCSQGIWTKPSLQCEIVDCGTPPALSNIKVITFKSTTYQSEATYNCELGKNRTSGSGVSKCELGGNWSLPSLECEDIYKLLTTSKSSTLSDSWECTDRVSGPSDLVDDSPTSVTCQGEEVLTGCSGIKDGPGGSRDGESISLIQDVPACTAYNGYGTSNAGVRARARCCSVRGLECEYLKMDPSESRVSASTSRTCKQGFKPTGCTAKQRTNSISGAYSTGDGCTAQKGPVDIRFGVSGIAICCSAPNMRCLNVESTVSGLFQPGDSTNVTCPQDYVMTGCMAFSPSGDFQGAKIENVSDQTHCLVFNGRTSTKTITASAVCCKTSF